MSLRTRVTLAAGGAVLVALVAASVIVYTSVRSKLHEQIDASLVTAATNLSSKIAAVGAPTSPRPITTAFSGAGTAELISSLGALKKLAGVVAIQAKPGTTTTGGAGKGKPVPSVGALRKVAPVPTGKTGADNSLSKANGILPLDELDYAVADGVAASAFRNLTVAGRAMRLYEVRYPNSSDGLIRVYRPLSEASATVRRVEWILLAITLGGAAAAALLGRLAAAAVLRPVRALASGVEQVKATRDLSQRIPVTGSDEVARLGNAFNAMLAELAESQRTQQQLIADASHELRTPLTSHRMNIELLARPDLPSDRRGAVLASAVRGIEDLSRLVGDLIHAARDGRSLDQREPARLDALTAAAVETVQRSAPDVRFRCSLRPCTVAAAPPRLERAIVNVLDNAAKWTTNGEPVHVDVGDGVVTVRDHGPGVPESDLPHVFDRFYRAAAARGLPGSGLGLAIVKQTVEDHGGTVTIANATGGGAVVSLQIPVLTNL
ncbi:MAG TPA: HAMP domain-containing sensor histidine kinase [Gaiellaceae bacterium]|nr:HAMP domain-containing sensor histidine kinase [Gaiellaceae bacterium]